MPQLKSPISDPILLSKSYCTLCTFIMLIYVLIKSDFETLMYRGSEFQLIQVLGLLGCICFDTAVVFFMKFYTCFTYLDWQWRYCESIGKNVDQLRKKVTFKLFGPFRKLISQ